jgi:DNA-binding NtrC family response regulator
MKRILVVDDDHELRVNISEILENAGHVTAQAANGNEAIDMITEEDFSLVLLDMIMPGMNGLDTLIAIKRLKPQSKIIMITAFATIQSAVTAMQKGASDFITKPFKIDELTMVVGRALEEARFGEKIARIGFDHAMSSLSNVIRRKIIDMLSCVRNMKLMEITRTLGIEDHTKVVFHLKILKDADVIDQNQSRSYFLTLEGKKLSECMKVIENYVAT